MSVDHVQKTIDLLQTQIAEVETELAGKKRVVNDLCKLANIDPVYVLESTSSSEGLTIRNDEFYGQPLQTSIKSILNKRKACGRGAASVNEIFDALTQGGYAFNAKNDEYAKRTLYQNLGKNTVTFHKLPNGNYGLMEWYPAAKEAKEAKGKRPEKDRPLHEELKEAFENVVVTGIDEIVMPTAPK